GRTCRASGGQAETGPRIMRDPVARSGMARQRIAGFGPISEGSAWLSTASITRSRSKYTVNCGYTQRLMVGHWRFWPPRGSRRWVGAPKRAGAWAAVSPRSGRVTWALAWARSTSRVSADAAPAAHSSTDRARLGNNRRMVWAPSMAWGVGGPVF